MTIEVKGLAWLGTRTANFEAMCRFYGELMGLPEVATEPGFAAYRLPSGALVEVFGEGAAEYQDFPPGYIAGFQVEDIETARAEMEAAGIEFIGPIHRGHGAWSHFRGPDGNVYEITQPAPPRRRPVS